MGAFASSRARHLEHVLVCCAWDSSSPICPSSTSPSGARAHAPKDPTDGPALGGGRLRHACRDAPLLCVQDPALYPRRLAVRTRHQGHRRLHERGAVVVGADRVQKVVLYTMLFEVVGLGCGFGPLNNRFFPPLGSILYWLRPSTIRLPPWPNPLPLTKGTARTPVDAALYAALLVMLLVALFADGTGPVPALDTCWGASALADLDHPRPAGRPRTARQGDLPCRPRRGVRLADRHVLVHRGGHDHRGQGGVPDHLDGRGDIEAEQALPLRDLDDDVEQPVGPNEVAEAKFFEEFPDDLRPGRVSRVLAHFSTAIELLVPSCCSSPTAACRQRSRRSSWCASILGSCRRSRWGCRWSGMCS